MASRCLFVEGVHHPVFRLVDLDDSHGGQALSMRGSTPMGDFEGVISVVKLECWAWAELFQQTGLGQTRGD